MTKEEKAYIAGFLDGDGCIMLQLIYRHDYLLGYQIRASIVFYQKTQYKWFLEWIKEKLNYGYIRNRNDGMSEYTIVGVKETRKVIKILYPYIRLKKKQADLTLQIAKLMPTSGRKMTAFLLYTISKEVDKFLEINYSKKRTNTSKVVKKFLISKNLLNSVETDS